MRWVRVIAALDLGLTAAGLAVLEVGPPVVPLVLALAGLAVCPQR